jgi:DivIVA domain-containing protein
MTPLDDLLTRSAADGAPGAAEVTSPTPFGPDTVVEGDWLTPADVHNKVFATVRLREGYDLGQVDTFLYEVEATLTRVLRDNTALRARLDASQCAASSAGDRASRIVALAQQTADRAITEAQEEARAIVAGARDEAEAVKREALTYGSRLRESLESLESQIGHLRSLLVEIDEHEDTY